MEFNNDEFQDEGSSPFYSPDTHPHELISGTQLQAYPRYPHQQANLNQQGAAQQLHQNLPFHPQRFQSQTAQQPHSKSHQYQPFLPTSQSPPTTTIARHQRPQQQRVTPLYKVAAGRVKKGKSQAHNTSQTRSLNYRTPSPPQQVPTHIVSRPEQICSEEEPLVSGSSSSSALSTATTAVDFIDFQRFTDRLETKMVSTITTAIEIRHSDMLLKFIEVLDAIENANQRLSENTAQLHKLRQELSDGSVVSCQSCHPIVSMGQGTME